MIYKPGQVELFWGPASPFSQWYPCKFTVTFKSEYKRDINVTFVNAEQWMMFRKAQTFGDLDQAGKILKEKSPSKVKEMGRRVKHFDEKQWDVEKYDIVRQGNIYKFSQNPELKKAILATKNKYIIEASPYDKVWGVGLGAKNKNIYDTDKWKGQNLLGKAIMSTRAYIQREENVNNPPVKPVKKPTKPPIKKPTKPIKKPVKKPTKPAKPPVKKPAKPVK